MGGHVREHHAAGADLRPGPDLDVAEQLRARADQHPGPDFGVPVAGLLPGAAQGHLVQDGDVVLDDRGLPHHHPGGVVDHDAPPDPRRGVDVHPVGVRHAALHEERGELAPVVPEPVGDAVRLEGVVSLEEEEGRKIRLEGRVTVPHGLEIGARAVSDPGVEGVSLVEELAQPLLADHRARELAGEDPREGVLQTLAVEDRRFEELPEGGLALALALRFAPDLLPYGAELRRGLAGGRWRIRLRLRPRGRPRHCLQSAAHGEIPETIRVQTRCGALPRASDYSFGTIELCSIAGARGPTAPGQSAAWAGADSRSTMRFQPCRSSRSPSWMPMSAS